MGQNQEEQTKLMLSLTTYLSFIYFEDKHIIFGTLEEEQSCSWFPPLPIPTSSCLLLLLESNSFLSREGLNTKGKENYCEHNMARAPFFSAAQSKSQLPAQEVSGKPFFLAHSWSSREESALYRHLWRTHLPK